MWAGEASLSKTRRGREGGREQRTVVAELSQAELHV